MDQRDLRGMTDEQLGEQLRSRHAAYDKACLEYDTASAMRMYADLRAVRREMQERSGGEWGRTGVERLTLDQLIERFIAVVIERNEADGMPEVNRLYWVVDDVTRELEYREGDQRRALFRLYMHPDVRIRQAAAEATRTLAFALSRERLLFVDDLDWFPLASVAGMSEADLDAYFPGGRKANRRIEASCGT